MKSIFNQQKTFLVLLMFWIILTTIAILWHDKIFWQLLFNNNHSEFGDWFFKYATWLGDGVFLAIASISLGFIRIRLAILALVSYLVSGLFAQLLKRLVFDNVHRPAYVFEQMGVDIAQVQDVALRTKHSFPSGHTTSAFAFFMSISLILCVRKFGWQAGMFALAIVVGISRIYLNLHFLNDVMFGSILGSLTTIFIYMGMEKAKAGWLDQSYISIIKSKRN